MHEFTEREKIVLYGLVKWPTLNDVELSERIGVKRPTLTAIRNKLEKERYYTTTRIPDFQKLGCELFVVKYGEFNPLTPFEVRKKYSGWQKFPESIFWVASDTARVGLSAGESYTEIKKHIDYSEQNYGEHDFHTDKGNTYLLFPMALSKIFNFLDFAPLLRRHFNLMVPDKITVDTSFKKIEKRKFNKSERIIFYALVKYPNMGDSEISKKVLMTRQLVNTIRKKFEAEMLLHTVRIPDLNKLGFELLVFMHMRFKPHASLKVMEKGVEVIMEQNVNILHIAGNLEATLFSVFKNYTDFQRTYDLIISFYKENDFLLANPEIRIFPIKDLRLLVYDRYAPLVKKVLGIEREV
jgi:hypothetical protein